MCQVLAPAMININKDRSEISAAVPKSSIIIRPTTAAMTAQVGRKPFRYNFKCEL